MSKLRIAFVSFEYPPDSGLGGIATYVAQAARLLQSRGHEVEVFASSSIRMATCLENGIRIHWIKETSREDFPVIAGHKIAEEHAKNPFDVLESPEYYADGRKAIDLIPELPLVVRLHTPSCLIIELSWPHSSWYPLHRGVELVKSFIKIYFNKSGNLPNVNPKQFVYQLDRTEKLFTQKANRVVALCNDMKKFAITKWQIDPKKLLVSPNMYHPSTSMLAINARPEGKTIGYFGRLERRKGVDLWVKAIPSILKKHPDTRFRFVGKSLNYTPGVSFDSWIKQTLKDYINQIDFIDYVPLDQMPNEYSLVDICVFPSRWENFPNVCLEAMSAAKAIIGSKHGGMAEMLPNKEVGLLVDPFSVSELVMAACFLLENSSERISMGKKARERVLMTYNDHIIGEQIEKIYHEAIAEKKYISFEN